ncbi:hypothetical protein BALOs_0842 [Halobacteriovorax sp. BALOs_7]|uniref:hypothetical protein n=1 Tax=unclassified Halobacteriovorax TaxID=2639665 RepID=UPI000EA1ADF0|nr:hypothetical protein [Halobacteriovorax sp. BALOs_7]AYF43852.1 hypothetical protein BALOs_0842 [Halobacteriovorax sp. BALOs_7]
MKNAATYVLSLSLFVLAGAIINFTIEFHRAFKLVPEISATIDKVPQSILQTSNEIQKSLPMVNKFVSQLPKILKEVKMTRELVPSFLDRAEELVNRAGDIVGDAKNIGEESSSGAVVGFFKGVVKAPFALIGSVFTFNGIELTKSDSRILQKTGRELLESGKLKKKEYWKNTTTGNSGSLEIIAQDKKNNCYTLNIELTIDKEGQPSQIVEVCRDVNGTWKIK